MRVVRGRRVVVNSLRVVKHTGARVGSDCDGTMDVRVLRGCVVIKFVGGERRCM